MTLKNDCHKIDMSQLDALIDGSIKAIVLMYANYTLIKAVTKDGLPNAVDQISCRCRKWKLNINRGITTKVAIFGA